MGIANNVVTTSREGVRHKGTTDLERWYGPEVGSAPTLSAVAPVATNTLYLLPYVFGEVCVIDRLGINCTAGNSAGRNFRLAVYKAKSASNKIPYSLVYDSGELLIGAGTGGANTITPSGGLVMSPGLYFMGFAVNNNTPTFRGISSAASNTTMLGYTSALGTAPIMGYNKAQLTSDAMTDPFGAVTEVSTMGCWVFYRLSA